MVQGDGAGLDVGANAHLLRRADQHRDVAGAGCGEQARLLHVGFRLVHVSDLLGGDAAFAARGEGGGGLDRQLIELAGGGPVVEAADGAGRDAQRIHLVQSHAAAADGTDDLVEIDRLEGDVLAAGTSGGTSRDLGTDARCIGWTSLAGGCDRSRTARTARHDTAEEEVTGRGGLPGRARAQGNTRDP